MGREQVFVWNAEPLREPFYGARSGSNSFTAFQLSDSLLADAGHRGDLKVREVAEFGTPPAEEVPEHFPRLRRELGSLSAHRPDAT